MYTVDFFQKYFLNSIGENNNVIYIYRIIQGKLNKGTEIFAKLYKIVN